MVTTDMAYCSPSRSETAKKQAPGDASCFTKEQLVRLAEAWNSTSATGASGARGPIAGMAKMTKTALWGALNDRMNTECGGSGREWCWADKLAARTPKPAEIEASLRPKKPKEWYSAPRTWLTNLDIDAVMRQYDMDVAPQYKYRFLGVYPIDFAKKSAFGKCLFAEICSLNFKRMYTQGIRYVGIITNLDKHNEGGSHWTSVFMCIDPKMSCFGAHYYDSFARAPPPEIGEFVASINAQIAPMAKKPFELDYNRQQHQFENSECGLFAMAYQIRWLTLLRTHSVSTRSRPLTIDKVTDININDKIIHELRDVLYRPSRGGGIKASSKNKIKGPKAK